MCSGKVFHETGVWKIRKAESGWNYLVNLVRKNGGRMVFHNLAAINNIWHDGIKKRWAQKRIDQILRKKMEIKV